MVHAKGVLNITSASRDMTLFTVPSGYAPTASKNGNQQIWTNIVSTYESNPTLVCIFGVGTLLIWGGTPGTGYYIVDFWYVV